MGWRPPILAGGLGLAKPGYVPIVVCMNAFGTALRSAVWPSKEWNVSSVTKKMSKDKVRNEGLRTTEANFGSAGRGAHVGSPDFPGPEEMGNDVLHVRPGCTQFGRWGDCVLLPDLQLTDVWSLVCPRKLGWGSPVSSLP